MGERATGTEQLLLTVDDGVALLTFNNPTKHNALSLEIREHLPEVLRAVNADDEVRVLVLTGAGDRAFVSGADISEFGEQRTTPEARASFDRAGAALTQVWGEVGKPIIAMIRGYCLGGGLIVAMQADIRIAAEGSQFGIPAARLGVGYGYAAVQMLADVVGHSWAAEILFSARRLDAHEAQQIGLVNRVVADDRLEAEVQDLARRIVANAPLTIAACRAALVELRRDPEQRDLERVREMVEAAFRSEDYREGQRAFLEKRAPIFRGH
jgi:enoyl-CoA hydratase/carnithine racemase